jgi:hypothetical protein
MDHLLLLHRHHHLYSVFQQLTQNYLMNLYLLHLHLHLLDLMEIRVQYRDRHRHHLQVYKQYQLRYKIALHHHYLQHLY